MKGVIFDKDGILFDTESIYVRSWKKAGNTLGYPITNEICHEISGTSKTSQHSILHRHFPDIDSEKTMELCLKYTSEEMSAHLPEKPGVHEILEYFTQKGMKIAVASSSPKDQIIENLNRCGIKKYFDHIVSGMNLEHGKPWPDIFLLAAKKLGLPPEECYVFEDSFNGVRAGHKAGCKTIMIPDQEQPTEEIKQLYTACYSDFFEVIDALEQGII